MYASKYIVSLCLIGCVAGAHADVLESWGDGTVGTEFSWYPNENRLVILDGNGNDYKF